MLVSRPLQLLCPCRVTKKVCQVSEFACVCLFSNSMGPLMTRGALLFLYVPIASHILPTSVFSHSAQLSGNSHLQLTFTCLAIKELINVLYPCFPWE